MRLPALPLAHALQGKLDLPIPEWLFVWAASLVLIVSFVALSVAWTSPRLEDDPFRPLPDWLSRVVVNPVSDVLAGVVGVGLLGLTIYAGLEGNTAPDQNFAVTFVFVSVWLGFVVFGVLGGNLFRAFNPWRAIGRATGALVRVATGGRSPEPLPYPERLGRWPAAAALIGFLLLELVFEGENPRNLAHATILYSAFTLIAMAAYGTDRWLDRGEGLSVYFGMISQLSPIGVRDRQLGLRRPLARAWQWFAVPGSIAIVVIAIGGTAFDGGSEGAFATPLTKLNNLMIDAGASLTTGARLSELLFMLAVILGVGAVFRIGIQGMRTISGSPAASRLAHAFAHTLVPIALAYVVAHYFSLYVYQEQAQFTYLLSDPLGEGSDLFGTASGGINYDLIGANAVWYAQVGALVAGHVCGLIYAHDKALVTYRDLRSATRSQYWMLIVMVAFTCLGLYLLSQSNR